MNLTTVHVVIHATLSPGKAAFSGQLFQGGRDLSHTLIHETLVGLGIPGNFHGPVFAAWFWCSPLTQIVHIQNVACPTWERRLASAGFVVYLCPADFTWTGGVFQCRRTMSVQPLLHCECATLKLETPETLFL